MREKLTTFLAPLAVPWNRLAVTGPAAREKSRVFTPLPPSTTAAISDAAPVPGLPPVLTESSPPPVSTLTPPPPMGPRTDPVPPQPGTVTLFPDRTIVAVCPLATVTVWVAASHVAPEVADAGQARTDSAATAPARTAKRQDSRRIRRRRGRWRGRRSIGAGPSVPSPVVRGSA